MWQEFNDTIQLVQDLLQQNQKLIALSPEERPKDAKFYKVAIYADNSIPEPSFQFQPLEDWVELETKKNKFWDNYCLVSKILNDQNLSNTFWYTKDDVFPQQIVYCMDSLNELVRFDKSSLESESNVEIVATKFPTDEDGLETFYLLRSIKTIPKDTKIIVYDSKPKQENIGHVNKIESGIVTDPKSEISFISEDPKNELNPQIDSNKVYNEYVFEFKPIVISPNEPKIIIDILNNSKWTQKWMNRVIKPDYNCKIVEFPTPCFELGYQNYNSPKDILEWVNHFVVGFYYTDNLLTKDIIEWPSIYFIHAVSEQEILVTEWISSSKQLITFIINQINFKNLYFFPSTKIALPFQITYQSEIESETETDSESKEMKWVEFIEIMKQKLCKDDSEFNNLIWKSNWIEYAKFIYLYYVNALKKIYISKWGNDLTESIFKANEKLIFDEKSFFYKTLISFQKQYHELKSKYPDYNDYKKENSNLNFEIGFISKVNTFLWGNVVQDDPNPNFAKWKQFLDQYLITTKCSFGAYIPSRYIIFRTWCILNHRGPFKNEINQYEEKIKQVEKLLGSNYFNISNSLLCN